MRKRPDYQVKSDQWYDWKGVKRPERTPNMTEEEIADKLANNLKGHKCQWIQQGNAIECHEGEYVHGKTIGTTQRLDGTTPDGAPILKPFGAIYRTDI